MSPKKILEGEHINSMGVSINVNNIVKIILLAKELEKQGLTWKDVDWE